MAHDTVQMRMIRRYARILREQQARYRGPRIGANERRLEAETPDPQRSLAESAARTALDAVRPASPAP